MTFINYKIAFFGTPYIAERVFNILLKSGIKPNLLVTTPDRRKGRGLSMSAPEAKIWAEQNNIEIFQPERLDDAAYDFLKKEDWDLFIVIAYGKIIPEKFLSIPKHGSVNIHPSLLPKYRGPSPLQAQIVSNEKKIGTTIMLMDKEMDHGPVLAQKEIDFGNMPSLKELTDIMADESAKLLIETVPLYIRGKIKPQEQDHSSATYCKMIKKEDGQINLDDEPQKNYLKYLAYTPWPGVFFFVQKNGKDMRVKITKASYENNDFKILRVIPEGKKEMEYRDFLNN